MSSSEREFLMSTASKVLPFYRELMDGRGPFGLTIFPTNRCNLTCEFCSNGSRDRGVDLDMDVLWRVVDKLRPRTVEMSGGGDPLCSRDILAIINGLHDRGIGMGIITNGSNVHVARLNWSRVDWVRFSVNGHIDHNAPLDLSSIPKNQYFGFVYIIHDSSKADYVERLAALMEKWPNARYCRVCVGNQSECHADRVEVIDETTNTYLVDRARAIPPVNCYHARFKPTLTAAGLLFPCSFVVVPYGKYQNKHAIRWDDYREPYHCRCGSCCMHAKLAVIESAINHGDEFVDFV